LDALAAGIQWKRVLVVAVMNAGQNNKRQHREIIKRFEKSMERKKSVIAEESQS
jgi:hypothetical protein